MSSGFVDWSPLVFFKVRAASGMPFTYGLATCLHGHKSGSSNRLTEWGVFPLGNDISSSAANGTCFGDRFSCQKITTR